MNQPDGKTARGTQPNRGTSLNNVLNIKYSPANRWWGQMGNDGTFSKFDTVGSGLRAGMIILNNYRKRGTDTIEEIVSTFAPSSENNTREYVRQVAEWSGISPDRKLKDADYDKVLRAMVRKETGYNVTDDQMRWAREHIQNPMRNVSMKMRHFQNLFSVHPRRSQATAC